ncbi:hypothetical protein [Nesterenkonia alba]|uniref:hypothetical protein n=1 Tax=Nesterenkonia alba TaxID=515814 RepID=UPI0003B37449|nr:hypothetical protein [Nesterenkonia alba]
MALHEHWAQRYKEAVVEDLGWGFEVDGDGDLKLDDGEYRFFINDTAAGDPEYLDLFCLFSRPEGVPDDKLAEILRERTERMKGAKLLATTDGTGLIATIGIFAAGKDQLPTREHIAAVLPRLRQVLLEAVKTTFRQIDELQRGADVTPGELREAATNTVPKIP